MTLKNYLKYSFRNLSKENWLARSRAQSLLSREGLERHEFERLADMYLYRSLSRAAEIIPAYKSFADKIPKSSLKRFVADNFPAIDKSALLSSREKYYPRSGVPLPWWSVGKTSGTSGTPLGVFRDLDSTIWEHAFHLQHWRWAGFRNAERQVVLRGDLVVSPDQSHPPYWHHDILGRQLILSTRHLNESRIGHFVDAINDFRATQLRAYPSAAYELARLVENHHLNIQFQSIITGSEILYPAQRAVIERVLGGKVFDFYGMAERVAFSGECEYGRMHMNPEYSFVEIVDSEGNPTNDDGFVTGTTFHNLAMPLVRYRLSDSARWNHTACPCGRTYPSVDRIVGKLEDTLFDLDGRPVSPSIVTFAFKGVGNIARSQVAQIAPQKWEIRIVPTPSYLDQDGQQLLTNIKNLVSTRLNVTLKLVPAIGNLPSGKYKWVSQECPALRMHVNLLDPLPREHPQEEHGSCLK